MIDFPVKFHEDEYDKRLGVYQKWISGDSSKIIEKIYSVSAFQLHLPAFGKFFTNEYQKYAEYLVLMIDSIILRSPEWYIRIYMDESIIHPENSDSVIWNAKLTYLKTLERVQIICVKFPRYYLPNHCHKELLPVMFRYLTLFDPNLSIILLRDIDNIYTEQHEWFVNEWLERGDDICFFMHENYKRQEVVALTTTDVILSDTYYNTILSGLWNFRKQPGTILPISLWQKIFAYIEDYTDVTLSPEYIGYRHYGQKFNYGFDELSLTRNIIPYFINQGMKIYTVPIRIYDVEFFLNLLENPSLTKFLRNLSDDATIQMIKRILIQNYWVMHTHTSGLAQYILCILTNIYFGILRKKSKYYTSETFINNIKNKVMPNVLLMSIGIFLFKNYKRYNWYPIANKIGSGSETVSNFLATNKRITIGEWTAGTYTSVTQIEPHEPQPDDSYNI